VVKGRVTRSGRSLEVFAVHLAECLPAFSEALATSNSAAQCGRPLFADKYQGQMIAHQKAAPPIY
jgi:hypothetical protein